VEHEYLIDGQSNRVAIEKKANEVVAKIDGREYRVDIERCAEGLLSILVDGRSLLLHYARTLDGVHVGFRGKNYYLAYPGHDDSEADGTFDTAGSDGRITTPMPGKIVAVNVSEGDAVEAKQALLVVESMKMQNDVVSPVHGTVTKIHHAEGENVEFGDLLVEIEVAAEGE